jgi:hypothetical protein
MRVIIERQPAPFGGTMPKASKELLECSLGELKEAYRLALLEKMEYLPESVFHTLVDEDMRAITKYLKIRKK